ncbi:hypothetical protein Taro_016987 [Colocasia esculenta]|uniref:Alliinase C-terminal domain-containing protein n=1 Tax=Colocasia esculenta TaxID=4460 RepID=A0A843URV5_COLES|nr:hypothetical protein [Colocasia esculenta]
MAKVSVGSVGSEKRKRGQRKRGQRDLPALVYLAGVVTVLSLTLNGVLFFRFHSLYRSSAPCGGAAPAEASDVGNAAAAFLLTSLWRGGNGSDGAKGVCLEEDEHVKASPGGARQQIGGSTVDCDSIVINLDHGDPTMYERFWRAMEDQATIVVAGSQTMSYFSRAGSLCWFMEPRLEQEIVRLHRVVGNAQTDGWHVVVGTGSTQLFQAALYALSPPETEEPISVVSAAPYYSSYPSVTDFLRSGLYRWAGDVHAFKFKNDAPYIELVCSPNNPDGFLKEAVLNGEKGWTIHDLAYYWPQYTPITAAAAHDIMLFTFSKITGHAGTRIGWALVKDRAVAEKMTKFIELNTIGVSKDSQLRAAQILGAVSDGYELGGRARFFDYGRRLMAERWQLLQEAARSSGNFSLPHFPSANCSFTGEMTQLLPGNLIPLDFQYRALHFCSAHRWDVECAI